MSRSIVSRLPAAWWRLAQGVDGAACACGALPVWQAGPSTPLGPAATSPGAGAGARARAGSSSPPHALRGPHAVVHARHFLSGFTAPEPSKVYQERRLMGWSPEQLYDVVSRVDDYHKFVPWCVGSTVLQQRGDGGYLEAELQVGFQVFVERYTSKVTLQRPHRVHSKVANSRLFDHLDSTWVLRPGPQPGTTWLAFNVDFAFNSALYKHVADLFFSEVVTRMMGAFEERCTALYGPSCLAGSSLRRPHAGAANHQPRAVQQQHQQQQQQHQLLHQQGQQQQQQRRLQIEREEGGGGRGRADEALRDAPSASRSGTN